MLNILHRCIHSVVLAIVLITPLASQAIVDMNISSFTDNPDPAIAGGEFHYLLTVENSGDEDALNASLSVSIPAEATVTNVSPGSCTGTGPVICSFGSMQGTLDSGSPVNIDITMTATSAGPLSISSTATASTTSTDSNSGNDSSTQGTTVNIGANLSVSFTGASATSASGGSTFDYVLDISNSGPNSAADQIITLTLPPEFTYQSGSNGSGWSCNASGQVVTCTRAVSLTTSSTAPSLTISALVSGSSTGSFTALAVASSSTDDGDLNNNTTTHDVTVTAGADLAITNSVSPNPVIAEQAVTYTINVTNNGPMTSNTVEMTNTLPANYTSISASGTGWSCSVLSLTVTCNQASLTQGAANAITINATAPLNANVPISGTTHSATATISSSTTDPVSSNDSATINYSIGRNQADLAVTKEKTPTPVAQGQEMVSTIYVQNLGPLAATGLVQINDQLAAGESYNSSSPASGTGWSCSYSLADGATGGIVTCDNTISGSIALNSFLADLVIPTTATGFGDMTNDACLATRNGVPASEKDFNTANDCESAGGISSTAATADLELTKAVADPGSSGTLEDTEDTLTYTLTVTNRNDTGDTGDDATNVVLTDPIPMYASHSNYGSTVIVATPSQGAACSIGSTVTCNLGTITNGSTANVVITVSRPMADGAWTNNATAFSTDIGDPNRSNNAASASTNVEPVTDVVMTAKSESGPILAGVEATYVLSFKNEGVSTAQGVEVIDTFTALNGMTYTFISATTNMSGASCIHDLPTTTVTCSGGTLTPNQSRSVTIIIRPDYDTGLSYPLNIENTATITTSTLESDGPANTVNPNNTQSATMVVNDAELDLLVQNQDFVDPLFYDSATPANNIVTYEVKITNQGPSYATGLSFTDTLTPASGQQLTFVCDKALQGDSCTTSTPGQVCLGQGTLISSATPINCNLPDMANSAVVYRYLDFRVETSPDAGGTTVQNSVTVTSNEPETLSGNNTASDQTTIRVLADVEVTSKVPDSATVDLNQPFNWTVTVHNNGPDVSLETTLTDTLPTGMVLTGPAVPAQGTCPVGIAGESSLSCDLGLLANGATTTVTIPVRVTSYTATLSNTASVATSAIDQVPANDDNSGSVTVQKSSIAGFVYEDNNDNGVKDSGENGVNAVTLTLTGTDIYGNTVNTTASTTATGDFLFDNLSPSTNYTITETHPTAYVDGLESVSAAIVANSRATDLISNINLAANTASTGYLFGELGNASTTGVISGYVYNDGSNDGVKDSDNPGIENVTITLTGTDSQSNPVNLTAITDSSGAYSFTNLLPGTYTLTETQPTGYLDNIDTIGQIDGSDVGTVANDVLSAIIVPVGGVGTEYNFANSNTAITGFVYVDINNNGIKNNVDKPIESAQLTLTGNDLNGTPINLTTVTDSTGAYSFTGMPASGANGYTVTETQPSAWADGKDSLGDVGGTLENDTLSKIIIRSSTYATGYNFGELGASLAGIVFNDVNNNGEKTDSESGIPNTTLTLTGSDINGNPINLTESTGEDGSYKFNALPTPNSAGYTITETQPPQTADGIDTAGSLGGTVANDVISAITFPAPGSHGTEYNFAEVSNVGARISGRVWFDLNHDRTDDEDTGQHNWVVEIIKRNDPLNNTDLTNIATTTTQPDGTYTFEGVIPGTGYEIRFRHPVGGYIYGGAISTEPGVDLSNGTIRELTVNDNDDIPDQNLPLDPAGVVYDTVTRLPVAGATVTFNGPPGFDPDLHLVGGSGNASQITDNTGFYQFLIFSSAPIGTYSLSVIEPAGYQQTLTIPACTNTINVGSTLSPALVQNSEQAPAAPTWIHNPNTCPTTSANLPNGADSTQYYLSFNLNPTLPSDHVLNNHIPVDPIDLNTGLSVIKTTPKVNVKRNDLVPYTIRLTNNTTSPITNICITDLMPPGFKYVTNSAILDGVRTEPIEVHGREIMWDKQSYTIGESHELKLILVAGSGVGEGEYVNQAWGIHAITHAAATAIAKATVRVIPDPDFDCSDLIGKVFDDKNLNGYQDDGERGLPGVRVVTARGLNITTDEHGRFHVPCAAVPNEMRGSNFIMKLDEQSLPSGYRITTENPRVVRLTRGKLAKLNFGAAIHRVVRLDLSAIAFDQESHELRTDYGKRMQTLVDVLSKEPSVLRVAYTTDGESKVQVQERLINFKNYLNSIWGDCDCNHELIIEDEVLWGASATRGSATTGRAK